MVVAHVVVGDAQLPLLINGDKVAMVEEFDPSVLGNNPARRMARHGAGGDPGARPTRRARRALPPSHRPHHRPAHHRVPHHRQPGARLGHRPRPRARRVARSRDRRVLPRLLAADRGGPPGQRFLRTGGHARRDRPASPPAGVARPRLRRRSASLFACQRTVAAVALPYSGGSSGSSGGSFDRYSLGPSRKASPQAGSASVGRVSEQSRSGQREPARSARAA